MMRLRDEWKDKAKLLSKSNKETEASLEEIEAWNTFKVYRNKINNRKKNEEKMFKSEKMKENINSAEQTWKTAKMFMNWKTPGSPSQLEINGKLVTKSSSIATHMNEFFSNTVKHIRDSIASVPVNYSTCHNIMQRKSCTLTFSHVSVQKVKVLLKSLKISKSTSIDELDNYIVKLSADYIEHPLHHIITLSVLQQKFPSCWKYGKIIPLYKKDCQLQAKNYRPVTI